MPKRSRPAADFYYTSRNSFDVVSNIIPASVKVNNTQNICCGDQVQSCDINLDELKDFMDDRIEEIKGTLVLSNAPVQLIETLYSDVIYSYNEEGPYSLPPIETITELYTAFNDIIESTSGCIDTRLLIYRDILQMTSVVKDTEIKKTIAENRVEKLLADNAILQEKVRDLSPYIITQKELSKEDIPKRKFVLGEWMPEDSFGMVYANRGVGKSWFCMAMAVAIANGDPTFLGWEIHEKRSVLYVDGEMAKVEIKERFDNLADQYLDNLFIL